MARDNIKYDNMRLKTKTPKKQDVQPKSYCNPKPAITCGIAEEKRAISIHRKPALATQVCRKAPSAMVGQNKVPSSAGVPREKFKPTGVNESENICVCSEQEQILYPGKIS